MSSPGTLGQVTGGGRPVLRISAPGARRIALAAQGLGGPRPAGAVDARAIRRMIDRLGLIQLDSVNVFCRSHYLPVFSRLGPYPRQILDGLAGHSTRPTERPPPPGDTTRRRPTRPPRPTRPTRRDLVEYWAHEASLVPVSLHPFLRWRMARADTDAWNSVARLARNNAPLIDEVLKLVAETGPIRAAQTGISRPAPTPGQMWNWGDGKIALEYLFYAGQVMAAGRVNFERLYDLPERVLSAETLAEPTPTEPDAQRQLVRIAARALGVATEPDLGDYFRLSRTDSKARVAELVESGELLPAAVDGWPASAYLWADARRPRLIHARALLSPFDSLIWFRPRVERLFDFRYRIEIYTPAAQRVYGYYVLPFLLGDALVARVDLKSDRQAGVLRVQGAFAEPGVDLVQVASELAAELRSTAAWLELDGVVVAGRGDLAAPLAATLARS